MCSQFSKDGKFYAQISTDGKLRVWNTLTNTFEQEFTPDFHLTSPCASLHFIHAQDPANSAVSPKKKKRRNSQTNQTPSIILGTSNGHLLCYSIIKATVDCTIDSETSLSINCLSAQDDNFVYSGADTNVLLWSLYKKRIQTKWNTGTEKIAAILKIPDCNYLLTASRQIVLWDSLSKERLRVYTGHSSEVCLLNYITSKNADGYFISGAKDDRLLSCWSLCEDFDPKHATVRFLMEDSVQNLSIFTNLNGVLSMAATVKSGIVHIYEQTLNGKCNKPLKAKTTIQLVSDGGGENETVAPIQICGSIYRDDHTLCLGYGGVFVKTFENITITTNKKVQCLIRKDPQRITTTKDKQVTNLQKPIVGNDVLYLTPQSSKPTTIKRKNDGQLEVPMERRLENLSLNKLDDMKVPRSDNVAQLLLQGLHSKDKNILRAVLCRRDEQIIKNTIKRLPMTVITQLVVELTNLIDGKTVSSQIGCMWLKQLITIHAGMLLSNPELNELFGSTLNKIESRLLLQTPLNRLKGRLDLLVAQMKTKSNQDTNTNDEVMIFNDKDINDSDNDLEIDDNSSSDHEWVEDSSDEENNQVADKMEDDNDDDDDDEEMST